MGPVSRYWQLLRDILTTSLRNWGGGHLFWKQKYTKGLRDITVPSVDSFRGHWRLKGVKMHIFVHQEISCFMCICFIRQTSVLLVNVHNKGT